MPDNTIDLCLALPLDVGVHEHACYEKHDRVPALQLKLLKRCFVMGRNERTVSDPPEI